MKTLETMKILNKQLPVTYGHNEIWTPVLRLYVDDWSSLLEVTGNVEVTNDLGFNVSIVGKFWVSQNWDDMPKSSGNPRPSKGFEYWITKYSNGGFNVTPNMHHANIFLQDISEPPKIWSRNVVYGLRATSSASKPDNMIQVDAGKLYCKIF